MPLVRSVVVIHLLNIGQISAIDLVANESTILKRVLEDILRVAVQRIKVGIFINLTNRKREKQMATYAMNAM